MKDQTDGVEFAEAAFVSTEAPFFQSSIEARSTFYATVLKRCFDLAFLAAMAPVVVPLVFVLWVFASRNGSALFVQDRVGKNGKIFKCLKFRTMIVDAESVLDDLCRADAGIAEEWRVNQKLENDPRITRIGKILRATSLDELPQLWNVLCGDMSIVGPRPFMAEQDEIYRAAGGRAYYEMRPGITGFWQVDGRGKTSFMSRISYDNRYFEDMSLKADVGVILKTIFVVCGRTGH
jgi:lipopolysaccharide/colanic/teichoic acid biosynthesis glycosyltransferase